MYLTWWLLGVVTATVGPWPMPVGCSDVYEQAAQELRDNFKARFPYGMMINGTHVRVSDFDVTCEDTKGGA